MKKTQSSRRWLHEHETDLFVKQARQEGFRSRAVYKLQEIDQKEHLIKPGMVVVDLGAAPGAWSQYALGKIGKGKILALDVLPMEDLAKVTFIQGDFTLATVSSQLEAALAGVAIDLLLSDMAPNLSGLRDVDQARAMYLVELALDFAKIWLKPGGNFLVKVFQGAGFEQYLQDVRRTFKSVKIRKPKASRARSNEVYLLGLNKIM